jgi:hypothetical protein
LIQYSLFLAIDIIIGSPPCIDYCGANAIRQGVDGVLGSYTPRFGKLIQEIQSKQEQHKIYFLAENVALKNDKEVPLQNGDLDIIKRAFGVEWVMNIDAGCFSPGQRNRTFLSNFPCLAKPEDYVIDENLKSSLFLSDDYVHYSDLKYKQPVKVNCFMASLGKIDDHPRMTVVKDTVMDDEKFLQPRPYNIMEREKIMGFPIGYVDEAGMKIGIVILWCVDKSSASVISHNSLF